MLLWTGAVDAGSSSLNQLLNGAYGYTRKLDGISSLAGFHPNLTLVRLAGIEPATFRFEV